MRGSTARRLRRLARDISVGQPDRAYTEGPKGVAIVNEIGADGKPNQRRVPVTGVIRLHPDCTRAVYHRIKAEARS